MTILEKLHAIEEKKSIYDIHYCRAGVGFVFYYQDKDSADEKESWRKALGCDRYYPSFESAVEAEYEKISNLNEA